MRSIYNKQQAKKTRDRAMEYVQETEDLHVTSLVTLKNAQGYLGGVSMRARWEYHFSQKRLGSMQYKQIHVDPVAF